MSRPLAVVLRYLVPALQEIQRELRHDPGPQRTSRALSVAEVAAKLGCSRSHVYHLLGTGKLPHLRLERRRVVTSEQLARYLNSVEVAG